MLNAYSLDIYRDLFMSEQKKKKKHCLAQETQLRLDAMNFNETKNHD